MTHTRDPLSPYLREQVTAGKTEFHEPLHGVKRGPVVLGKSATASTVLQQHDRPATPREQEAIQRLMARTEAARGLSFLRPVPVRVRTPKVMGDYMVEVAQRYPLRLQRSRVAGILLGILPVKTRDEDLLDALRQTQLDGYYDPQTETLVLRNQIAMSLVSAAGAIESIGWRSVVMHELVHALQDQHFGLSEEKRANLTTDAFQALMALIEGDATLAMINYQVRRAGVDFGALLEDPLLFDEMLMGTQDVHGSAALGLSNAQSPGLFRYQSGARFAAALIYAGGRAQLDGAYRRPPASTHEVLDDHVYLQRDRRVQFRKLPTSWLTGRGYQLLHEDVLGRVSLSWFLQEGGLGGDLIASRWQADRLLAFSHRGRPGAVWVLAMDNDESAEAVAERARTALSQREWARQVGYAAGAIGRLVYVIQNVDRRHKTGLVTDVRRWLSTGRALRR